VLAKMHSFFLLCKLRLRSELHFYLFFAGCNKTLQLISQNAAQPGWQLCQMILLARRTKLKKSSSQNLQQNFKSKKKIKKIKIKRTEKEEGWFVGWLVESHQPVSICTQ